MVSQELITRAKQIAYEDSEKNGIPSIFQIDFSAEIAIKLAKTTGADTNIVTIGAYLMDCMLGTAYKQNKLKEHIQMSADRSIQLFEKYPGITKTELDNVITCILEHHGTKMFSSIESEVCCNADCYKFASVKGMLGSLNNMKDMGLEDIVKLFDQKADEKWDALSLNICKKELEPEYISIKELLKFAHPDR